MIRLFLGSIATSLLMIAPIQNIVANQPSRQHSFAQFCRDLQAKDDFTVKSEKITKFATKTQWRFDRHQLGLRTPATRL